jgi:phospholipid-translocating ATPase
MGILDQDVSDKVSLAVPQLYRRGIERKEWTQRKFWLYMVDGLYQSVITFYFAYLNFEPATFVTDSGKNINDYKRMGVFIANPAVVIVNVYILMNMYRWDWFMLLITTISILLIFFWTGVYTSFTAGFTFYESGAEVYGALSFWCNALLTVILALLPRFCVKSFQKMYLPRDVDIVREQIRQGKFDYLKDVDPDAINPPADKLAADSASSSELSKPQPQHNGSVAEDMKPIYPPSVTNTATTHNPRSHNGSDGTDYTQHETSLERAFGRPVAGKTDHSTVSPTTPTVAENDEAPPRPSFQQHRARPSFERFRSSMDRTRPSFEASRDFTSAAYLQRVESNLSATSATATTPGAGPSSRRQDISDELRQ